MDYDPTEYGRVWAERYDSIHATRPGTQEAAAFLAELAGDRPVLEFAIGTGRIALPLAERGVKVTGLDASEPMVSRLRAKPGGDAIEVVMGDMATTRVPGEFGLVYLTFNTLFALPSQETQVECFRNAARHLTPGGVFVLETFVPALARLSGAPTMNLERFDDQEAVISFSQVDTASQTIRATNAFVTSEGLEVLPIPLLRYAWPPELDLMAQLAGLRLRERYGSWAREPYDADSTQHVSVYELAAPAGM